MPTSDRRAPEPPDAVTPAAGNEGRPALGRPVRTVDVQPGTGSVDELVEAVRAALARESASDSSDHLDDPVPAVAVRPAERPNEPLAISAARRAVTAHRVPRSTALIVATSASTGAPRGVLIGREALTAAARASAARLQPWTGARGVDWWLAMPMTSIAGLMVVVRHVVGATWAPGDAAGRAWPGNPDGVLHAWHGLGGAARFTPGTAVDDIARARESATAAGRALVTSLAPTQVRRLLGDEAGRQALASFEVILVGGAALDESVRREATDAGATLVSTYGMTETCGGVVYDGVPLDGVQVRILGDGTAAPAAGRIAIGGTLLADGYLEPEYLEPEYLEPEGALGPGSARPSAPNADITTEFADGWVLTCDLGRVDREVDGGERLTVVGRADQRVKVRGTLVDLLAVQHAAERVPGVTAACAVGVPEPDAGTAVVLFVEASDDDTGPPSAVGTSADELAARIREELRGALGPASTPGRVIVGALDWLPSGKPDRVRLQRRAREQARQEGT